MKKFLIIICSVLLAFGSAFTVSCSKTKKSTQYYNSDIVEFYHDQAYVFMQPLEPTKNDEVTIRIRTLKGNVKDAVLRYSNEVDVTLTAAAKYKEIPMQFEKVDDTGYYEYFVCKIPKQSKPYMYHFKLSNKKETIYVNNPYNVSVGKPNPSTVSDFYVMPGFKTPDWAKGALWYSLMPDGFNNGEVTNDKLGSGNTLQQIWGVDHIGANDYLGGDMQGIIDKIDYLKELNVTALFMNPIWTATHQAGYGSYDLMQIDSAFGNEELLRSLISNLHENDIKLMKNL